jgi:hypothetical protein
MKASKRSLQVYKLLRQQGSPQEAMETLTRVLSAMMVTDANTQQEAIQDAVVFSADLIQDVMEEWEAGERVKDDFKLKIFPGGRQ